MGLAQAMRPPTVASVLGPDSTGPAAPPPMARQTPLTRDVLIVGRGIEHREDLRLDGIDERIGVLDAHERVPAAQDLAGRVVAVYGLERARDLGDPGQRGRGVADRDVERAVLLADRDLTGVETRLLERGAETVGGIGDGGGRHLQSWLTSLALVDRKTQLERELAEARAQLLAAYIIKPALKSLPKIWPKNSQKVFLATVCFRF